MAFVSRRPRVSAPPLRAVAPPPARGRDAGRRPAAQRRREILEAARRVLEDREYHDVTMDDVSRRAGLAKGSLYLHFPTKERLFRELVEDMHAELLESLDRVRGSSAPGEPRVRALIAAQLGFFERHRGVFLQVFQGQMPFLCGDARRSRDMVGATLRVTTDVIEEAVRLRRFRSLDGPTAAIGLFGLIRGFVFAHILCGSSPALGSRAGVIWDLFFRGARA